MKLLTGLTFVFLFSFAYGQQNTNTQTELFVQCLFSIPTQVDLDQVTQDIKSISGIKMVRLDLNTQRALITTTGINSVSEQDVMSWFGSFGNTVHCTKIGVMGVDEMMGYPYNCND